MRADGDRFEEGESEALANDEGAPHPNLFVPRDRAEEFIGPRRGIETESFVALDR